MAPQLFEDNAKPKRFEQEERSSKRMKPTIEETTSAELELLLGEQVTLFCQNYIYTGKLVGVNDTCVKLQEAAIVYLTEALTDKVWKDARALPSQWYVQISAIESFGILK